MAFVVAGVVSQPGHAGWRRYARHDELEAVSMVEIRRLHLARLTVPGNGEWPVHGFVVTHPGGAVLVDTGVGGPPEVLSDWRVVNRTVADALGDLDMSPADIDLVINTHLHFDHCGQNAVFSHAACWVQRTELARAQTESPDLYDWFGFMNARFELLDGDTEVLPGLSVIATPGHTSGHQSVVVTTADGGAEILIGDAAYTPAQYHAGGDDRLPDGQAADRVSWQESVSRIHALDPARVHFCHDTAVVTG
jgi:N-acyl homoserine lactone hydrolase